MILRITKSKNASAGNRTRAARVAGEHSTTEPPMLVFEYSYYCIYRSYGVIRDLLT